MSNLKDLTLDELRALVGSSECEAATVDHFAKRLNNEQVHAQRDDDKPRAEALFGELRGLWESNRNSAVVCETYATWLYNNHALDVSPETNAHALRLLKELRALEESASCTAVVIDRYARALNNAHVRAGKWDDPELGRFAREEFGRISNDSRASSQVIEYFATSLSDGHHRMQKAGAAAEARSLLERLRLLSTQYPDNEIVALRLAKALANETNSFGNQVDRDVTKRTLDELRGLCKDAPSNSVEVEHLAMALANAYIQLKDATASPEAVALMDELRELAAGEASEKVRGNFAKVLRNKHFYLSEAGLLSEAETPLTELRSLDSRFPGDAAVAEQFSSAISNALDKARRDGRPHSTPSYLEELRGLLHRNRDHALLLNQFSRCLYNAYRESLNEPAYGISADLLAELEELSLTYPADASVRERVGKALVNGLFGTCGTEAGDQFLDRLRQLSIAYPDDSAIKGSVAEALSKVHLEATKSSYTLVAEQARSELRLMAEDESPSAPVIEEFSKMLQSEVHCAIERKALFVADTVLDELRAWHCRHLDSGSAAVSLAVSIAERHSEALENGFEEMARDLLQELRDLAASYPAEIRITRKVAIELGRWFARGVKSRQDPYVKWALEESRAVCEGQSDPTLVQCWVSTLAAATSVACSSLRLLPARSLWKELNDTVEAFQGDAKVQERLFKLRREIKPLRWIGLGILRNLNSLFYLLVGLAAAVYYWTLLHRKH